MNIPVPITNERGETLLAMHAPDAPQGEAAGAIAAAIVLARHAQGVVLVHNRRRQVWELPGGFLDAGESPLQGALRELREEAGCEGVDLRLLGILEIDRPQAKFMAERRMRCALFGCAVASRVAPADAGEVDAVSFWRAGSMLSPISAIDAVLLDAYQNGKL